MTSTQASPDVAELRQLFRYLQEWRSLYEQEGIDEILTPRGRVWSLWDLEYLYEKARDLLTSAQYRAITLFLVYDFKEQDAAEMMGVSRTNPIGMYAALGLARLVEFIDAGGVERFRSPREDWQKDQPRQVVDSLYRLAEQIQQSTRIVLDGCWQYTPTLLGREPKIRLRSRSTASGFLYVHPMQVLYVVHVGVLPPGVTLRHRPALPHHLACVNHEHARLVRTDNKITRRAS